MHGDSITPACPPLQRGTGRLVACRIEGYRHGGGCQRGGSAEENLTRRHCNAEETSDNTRHLLIVGSKLGQRYDAGPTLNQQWLNISCLLGTGYCCLSLHGCMNKDKSSNCLLSRELLLLFVFAWGSEMYNGKQQNSCLFTSKQLLMFDHVVQSTAMGKQTAVTAYLKSKQSPYVHETAIQRQTVVTARFQCQQIPLFAFAHGIAGFKSKQQKLLTF